MHPIIEKYGKPFTDELMDIMLISELKVGNEFWRDFLIRHDLIKKTTKTVRSNCRIDEVHNELVMENGTFVRRQLDTPIKRYIINLVNGRGQTVFSTWFKETDIPQIMEELANETN